MPESCYIIAYQKELDKKYVSFEDALGLVLGNGMAAIIICNDFAVIETEQYSGTPFRYIYTDKFQFSDNKKVLYQTNGTTSFYISYDSDDVQSQYLLHSTF